MFNWWSATAIFYKIIFEVVIYMSVSEKIYELRKKKNMSQEELAGVLNVTRQTISKWETGESNPDFDKIVPLCNFFQISTDEFLKDSNPILEKEIVRVSRNNKALVFSLCIAIFTFMTMMLVILDEVGANDAIMAIITLVSIGSIAVILVYYFFAKPIDGGKIEKSKKNKQDKLISSIINLITILVYFIISLIFGWAYTWIILIVGLLFKKVVLLGLLLRSDENEK